MKTISKEWLILIIIAIVVIAIGIFQWNKTSILDRRSSPDGEVISKEEAEVIVQVEYLKNKSLNTSMVFQIALDTHSVNLDEFDFQKDIRILKDGKSFPPLSAIAGGADHHRNAEVTFKKEATPYAIVIYDLAGIKERKFVFN